MKVLALNIVEHIRCKTLFELCLWVSLAFHIFLYGAWQIKSSIIPSVNSEEIDLQSLDIDFNTIPPELTGGYTDPAPVEVQEWIEGNNAKKKNDPPPVDEEKINAVSGTGTDKDGYLYSVKGDRPPRPLFNFDLRKFFPYEARRANITEKVVVIRIKVDERGRLISSSVISEASGYGFDEAAVRVINLARFIPGYRDGVPVKMIHNLAIRFVLD